MSFPLVFDMDASPFEAPLVPVLPLTGTDTPGAGQRQAELPAAPPQSIFALHLVNGEHYSGAERVQDLLARQLPQFGCEVGFACVKPQRFPNARETKTAPLVEMPMRGRFDLRVVKRICRRWSSCARTSRWGSPARSRTRR